MSIENLILAARPESAAALVAAGGQLPNISELSETAQQKLMAETLESLTAEAVNVMQGVNSLMANTQISLVAARKQVAKLEADAAYAAKTISYFKATNNLFPARKLAGIPTGASVLARHPKIDEIPDDWTPPAAATPAAQTGSSS